MHQSNPSAHPAPADKGVDGDDEGDSEDEEEDEEERAAAAAAAAERQIIEDRTQTNQVNLRRTIYLTLMSSMDFEEVGTRGQGGRIRGGGDKHNGAGSSTGWLTDLSQPPLFPTFNCSASDGLPCLA
jgi:hypothetical protein